MLAPRGRKFASIVNLCGGFYPRSPPPGNKYDSLVRGRSNFSLGAISRYRLGLDIRRNASPICPDFRGELKVPVLGRPDTTLAYVHLPALDLRDFPYVLSSRSPIPYLFSRYPRQSSIREQEFPRRRLRRRLACLASKEYLSSSRPRSLFPSCRRVDRLYLFVV